VTAVAVARPVVEAFVTPLSRPLAPVNPYTRLRKVLGDPTPLACTVAKEALEVVLGGTGLNHLNRWVTPEVRASLARQCALAQRAGRRDPAPVRIVRIRVYRVSDVAAETSIVADDGKRVRAIAARFEDVGERWQATVLEIG
jgi:hypothetical protein